MREAARGDRRAQFTALLHHITESRLRRSFYLLKRRAAAGVDGVTWYEYENGLGKRLQALHGRIHAGSYRATPSRRTYIPKPDGGERPLGIAALEDKIVQHALGVVLQQIYEVDFLGFSYGFRPNKGPHRALDALAYGITKKNVNWILDADIRGYFDTISHEWLMRFLAHRVKDRRVLRLVRKEPRKNKGPFNSWAGLKGYPDDVALVNGMVVRGRVFASKDVEVGDFRGLSSA